MGVDTKLLLNPNWELNDIRTVIEKEFKTKVEVESCHKTSIGMFHLSFEIQKEKRMMTVFMNNNTPLGPTTYLSLGYNAQAVEIMSAIANVFGGLLEKKDCDGDLEMITGMFSPGDGIPYFYKDAIINKEITKNDDLVGLNEHIHNWCDRMDKHGGCNSGRQDMNLFPKGKTKK
jgi:hypothetical protein